jgi:isopropylmalate/homocitrate/citramalate synthase
MNLFDKKILTNTYYHKLYNLYKPIFFDITLSKGIQNANPAQFSFKTKKIFFNAIMNTYSPSYIEIGSLESPKISPIMSDTIEFYDYLKKNIQHNKLGSNFSNKMINTNQIYIAIPSYTKLEEAIKQGISSFTFSTSISNIYQDKTTGKNIQKTKEELIKSFELMKKHNRQFNTFLYISCVNHCPIGGKLDIHRTVREILEYHVRYDFNTLCLTDTCGNLDYNEFEYIVDTVMHFGVHKDKLSLELQINKHNQRNVEKIIWYCLNKNIKKFAVSILSEENQSTNTRENELLKNLHYITVYQVLNEFIEWKINKNII